MSDRERETDDSAVDPPVDQPGGDDAMSLDAPSDQEAAVDPPVDQPGGKRPE